MATINKPLDQGLNVQIGENKRLNKSASEKFQEFGYGIYGLGSGIKGLTGAAEDATLLKNLDAGADDIAKQYGISRNAAKIQLLLGKITPQGLGSYTEKTNDVFGNQLLGPILLEGLKSVFNQKGLPQFNPQGTSGQPAQNPNQVFGNTQGNNIVTDSTGGPAPTGNAVFGTSSGSNSAGGAAPQRTFKEGEQVNLQGNVSSSGGVFGTQETQTPPATEAEPTGNTAYDNINTYINSLPPERQAILFGALAKNKNFLGTAGLVAKTAKDKADINYKSYKAPSEVKQKEASARASNASGDLNEQRAGTKPAGEYVKSEIGAKNRSGTKAAKPTDILVQKALVEDSLDEAKVNLNYLSEEQARTLKKLAVESGYDEGSIRSAYKRFVGNKLDKADKEWEAANR